jgi:HNH endonuclease
MHPDHITSLPCATHEIERWLPIPDWVAYDVSDWGRVRSYYVPGYCGVVDRQRLKPKIVGGNPTVEGYRSVCLYKQNSRSGKTVTIHILVLEAFVGPRPRGLEGCHNDGDGSNNHLSNLRWDTRSENILDRFRHGACRVAKLTEADIPVIWARLLAKDPIKDIASDYGVTVLNIQHIKAGRRWSYITRDLPGQPTFRHRGRSSR